MSDDKFKLPGSSYDELCKIVMSYGHFDKPFSLDEAAQVAKLNRTQISRNNGFLGAVGIIEGDRSKTTTELGKRLAHALEFDLRNEITSAWREIVLASDFLSKMFAAVKIRKGMDDSTLQSHIAYSTGQKKTKEVMTGARAIIDLLKNAEMLSEIDGQLVPMEYEADEKKQFPQESTMITSSNQTEAPKSKQKHEIINNYQLSNGIPVNIQIQINVNLTDLDGLGQRIKKLQNELNASIENESEITNNIKS